ncbi:hypothetical protein BG006_008485 [Podila minutissima]|uniref:Uncharacterized protein n=1 Tax=Podila minutissima TaxID=64525 RepID=A0A9P5SI98_9FUNG|nr:hypothetical protein BG006_008485 [Podila minutissima]
MPDTPPAHFTQSPDQWDDLYAFMMSRRTQNATSHFSKFRAVLGNFIAGGSDEQKQTAKTLKATVTLADIAEAVKEVLNSPKASHFKERADRLSKMTIDTVEAPLGATTKYFKDNVTEVNRASITTGACSNSGKSSTRKGNNFIKDGELEDQILMEDMVGDFESSVSIESIRDEDEEADENGDEDDNFACLRPLNQKLKWYAGRCNILASFWDFKNEKENQKYSLSKDTIADLSSIGNTFEDAIRNSKGVDYRVDLIRLITLCLDPMKFYAAGSQSVKERQYFVDLVLPCFRQTFWLFGLSMSILETQVQGCARHLNANRIPLVEKVVTANFADATVAHDGLQPVLVECGPPNNSDHDKRFSGHYKLIRDLKDTWVFCTEGLIRSNRIPPTNMKVFGVQAFGQEVELYCLDFVGCFRLQQLTSFIVPSRGATNFAETFKEMVECCYGFAQMVAEEVGRWDRADQWLDESKRRMAENALGCLPITIPRSAKELKKRQGVNEE